MKIVFFGTPEYVVPIVDLLHKSFKGKNGESPIAAVVTQPPKPVGRDKKIEYSAVDTWAHTHKIPIIFEFEQIPQADIAVCAAFGKIFPGALLNNFNYGILNMHPSLLPLWRGTSPTQATIMSGEEIGGLTVIKTDEQMDHGAIVSSFKTEISDSENAWQLRDRLFLQSAQFLVELIPSYISGKTNLKEQIDKNATFTNFVQKDHGYIPGGFVRAALEGNELDVDWNIGFMKDFSVKPNAKTVSLLMRSLAGWPGTFGKVNIGGETKRIKFNQASLYEGKLILEKVQLEGKNEVSWDQFCDGHKGFEFV